MDKEAGGTRARRAKLRWTAIEESEEEDTMMNCKPWLLQNRLVRMLFLEPQFYLNIFTLKEEKSAARSSYPRDVDEWLISSR